MLLKPTTIALALFANLGLFADRANAATIDLRAHKAQDSNTLLKREGINCHGSYYCKDPRFGAIMDFTYYIAQIPDDKVYTAGQYIACTPQSICLFLQKTTGSVSARHIKKLLNALDVNGCEICGSIPTGFFEGVNDNKNGELTANYVINKNDCMGLCDTLPE